MQPEVLPTGSAPRPFRVDIPQATIDRILNRVRDTQWPDRLDATDWRYGANWEYMKALTRYWMRAIRLAQGGSEPEPVPAISGPRRRLRHAFRSCDGSRVEPKSMPLILTHGWPGSVVGIHPGNSGHLSDPASFGGSPEDAFDVVVPVAAGLRFFLKAEGQNRFGPGNNCHPLESTDDGRARLQQVRSAWRRPGKHDHDPAWTHHILNSSCGLHFNGIGLGAAPAPPESNSRRTSEAGDAPLLAYRTTEMEYNFEQRNKPANRCPCLVG